MLDFTTQVTTKAIKKTLNPEWNETFEIVGVLSALPALRAETWRAMEHALREGKARLDPE